MTTEVKNKSLDITEPIVQDNSIESFQYQDYTPQSQDNLDQYGNIYLSDSNRY